MLQMRPERQPFAAGAKPDELLMSRVQINLLFLALTTMPALGFELARQRCREIVRRAPPPTAKRQTR